MKTSLTILALALTGVLASAQSVTTEQTTTTATPAPPAVTETTRTTTSTQAPAVVTSPAASSTTTTTTTSTGTVSQFTPGSTFIVKESSGPVSYRYGDSVTYVTRSGQVITQDQITQRIRVGAPVSVEYATQGDARVVNRIVIDDDEIKVKKHHHKDHDDDDDDDDD